MRPLKNNQEHIAKIKEAITNTQDNMEDTAETLQNVSLSAESVQKLQAQNRRREQSIAEFRDALEEEFTD
ncbi:MAG: hypothetical protein OWU32_13570 [Firmicutes bacterium]|nr:hypothetical protein [Bacillota bacterium]